MEPPTPPSSVTLTDRSAAIVVDERAWPIVVATWFGEPTPKLVETYFEHHRTVLERARSERTRIVLVTDTFATERPSATARRRITELTAAQAADAAALTLQSYVVIESPVMRGVVTALSWVYPDMAQSENVGSLALAIEGGLARLREAGIATPAIEPARVVRPPRPPVG